MRSIWWALQKLTLSFFPYLKSPFGAQTAQGHIPHLSPREMIREKLIPRASWKPNHQPMASADPKLQKYGDAAPKTVEMNYKAKNAQRPTFFTFQRTFSMVWIELPMYNTQREREIQKAQRKSLVHLSLSFSGWKAILLVDWRMMLLLREQLHQLKERRRRRGLPPQGAVGLMGELSNAPLSKLPSKHGVTARD